MRPDHAPRPTPGAPVAPAPRVAPKGRLGGLAVTAACTLVCSLAFTVGSGGAGPAAAADRAGHPCVVAGRAIPPIAWSRLRNPILATPGAGVKDQALLWVDGRWHLLFSDVTEDAARPGGVRWNVATATSTDLVHWSAITPWPAQPGTLGVASPDVTRSPSGAFVVTYQSDPGQTDGSQDRLFYRTSPDLVHWSAPHPLAPHLAPSPADRMIDGALAWTGDGLILGYKAGTASSHQAFEIAWSPSGSLQGPWTLLGAPAITVNGDTVENYEFLTVGGSWRLVATSNVLDQPWIFRLAGDPSHPASWLHWTGARALSVPAQAWDSGPGISSVGFEHANSAFLCAPDPARPPYYLLYAGSSELTRFGGWGHAEIGIARSNDLVHWQVP